MSYFPKTVIQATQDDGNKADLASTAEGHLEVAIHSPRLPFGSIHTESLDVVFQTDSVYGINVDQIATTTGLSFGTGTNSASCTGDNNLFTCSTGTTAFSFASLQSRKRLRYRPGQGVIGRFAGFFSPGAANSIVVAGLGTAESGFYFCTSGTNFGILWSNNGVREVQTLTVVTASTSTNSYTVTLPDTSTVTVTASNNSSTVKTAYELSLGNYPGWDSEQVGSTVRFLANSVGNKTGTFSIAQTGAVTPASATCVETVAGVAGTDTFIPQSTWNGDKLDGTGPSGVSAIFTKGNVYEINIQYLGFGSIEFKMEASATEGNNPDFVTVHTLKYPNLYNAVHSRQPSYPFTMAAYSAGSTTNVYASVGSFMGAIEGQRRLNGPRISYTNNTTSSTTVYVPLFTIRNDYVYNNRASQVVIMALSVLAAAKSTQGVTTVYLIKNAYLSSGTPNFTAYASGKSCASYDTAATGCTFSNDQLLWSGTVSESGQLQFIFENLGLSLQPGETWTLACKSITATAAVVVSFNTREDQ